MIPLRIETFLTYLLTCTREILCSDETRFYSGEI